MVKCSKFELFQQFFFTTLIIEFFPSDPADFPNLAKGELPDVSVPTFTDETKSTKTSQRKAVGDTVRKKKVAILSLIRICTGYCSSRYGCRAKREENPCPELNGTVNAEPPESRYPIRQLLC